MWQEDPSFGVVILLVFRLCEIALEKCIKGALNRPVLVLNRLWQPLHATTAKRAITLLCLGHAKVVQTEGEAKYMVHDFSSWVDYTEDRLDDPRIHTVALSFSVPQIIVLDLYDQLPVREVKFSRQTIFQRDSHTCQYCRKTFPERELNLDHVLPKDKGGKTTWENIVTSCIKCNTRKANKLPREANMFPFNEPKRPRWKPLFGVDESELLDDVWREFVKT